ncbi:MAG TPA: hypothetical protein VGO52_05410 [Hyphomonadaceae bacterium]|jgi:hypothetical protein|nr:hypothetical protein [Hyphomonadaceae bacterium]
MFRPAALATVIIAFALPAVAQQARARLYQEPGQFIAGPASPAPEQQATPSDKPLDWSKPVVGVDGNILNAPAKDAPLPVEVYTTQDLNAQKSPSPDDFNRSLKKPEERCDPAKVGVTVQCTAPKDGAPPPAVPPHN